MASKKSFTPADFSFELNKSWAELVEEEVTNHEQPEIGSMSVPADNKRRIRKATSPKKKSTTAKFVRSLEQKFDAVPAKKVEAMPPKKTVVASPRRSERIAAPTNHRSRSPTPTERRVLRKRKVSDNSTADEEASPSKRAAGKHVPCKRRSGADNCPETNFPTSSKTPTWDARTPTRYPLPETWEEPKLGWCTDEATLQRRNKEISKAKMKPVYARYLTEVPKDKREKGIHPRTPNKLLNYSRRSWDAMVRTWKRQLYLFAGEEPSESANTSFIDSDTQSETSEQNDLEDTEQKNTVLAQLQVNDQPRPETDSMASLLGHFDLDSRRGFKKDDDRTLDGAASKEEDTLIGFAQDPVGPLDFSELNGTA